MKLSTLKSRLKGFVAVENFISPKSGNEVSNQFLVRFDNGSLFKSYSSIIAIKYKGKIYLTPHWDYSVTTNKYRSKFLGEGIAETRLKIKSGEYKILDNY